MNLFGERRSAQDAAALLLTAFRGRIMAGVQPLPAGPARDYLLTDPRAGAFQTCKSPRGSAELYNDKEGLPMAGNDFGYSYSLGQMTISSDGKKADLIINLPFFQQGKFMCFRVEEKRNANSPDWIVRHNRCQVGSMWKKQSEKGTDYLSGNVLFVGYPGALFYFSVFVRERDGKKSLAVVYNPPNGRKADSFPPPDPADAFDDPGETISEPDDFTGF